MIWKHTFIISEANKTENTNLPNIPFCGTYLLNIAGLWRNLIQFIFSVEMVEKEIKLEWI
jgi:hypothetical protein